MAAELMIHTADLSSPSKTWEVSLIWSERVNEEFKNQNIFEEQYSDIPITPFFRNLDDPKVLAKQEMCFLQFIVIPLWKLMDEYLEGQLAEPLKNIV